MSQVINDKLFHFMFSHVFHAVTLCDKDISQVINDKYFYLMLSRVFYAMKLCDKDMSQVIKDMSQAINDNFFLHVTSYQ